MIRVFDFRTWWSMVHNDDQMELMGHVSFYPIRGHTHLFVADVSEADEIMLKLLGIPRDHSILTGNDIPLNKTSRILYNKGEWFEIIEVSHAASSKQT